MQFTYRGAVPALGILVLALLGAPPLQAAKTAIERLDIIERKLESRGLVELMNRIEQMQQDLQEMRGEMEVQGHAIEKMQRQQRQQYLDIDRRLRLLDRSAASVPSRATPNISPPEVARPPAAGSPATAAPEVQPVVPTAGVVVPPPAAGGSGARTGTAMPSPRYPTEPGPLVEPVPGSIEQVGEEAEYNAALTLLKRGQYPEAVEGFKKFIADYPGSSYVDNAHYWLGEAYYVTRNFDRAMEVFRTLVTTYPRSNKVPGSRLKIGYVLYEKKAWPASREELTAVVIDYPGSTVARQANERLARMKQEGN